MPSLWIHDYSEIKSKFGSRISRVEAKLIAKQFDTIILNNTDGFGNDIVDKFDGLNVRILQWILDPKDRDERIEQPLKKRDGIVLDIEDWFIRKYPLENILKKFKRPDDKVYLCLPSNDYLISYPIRGYTQFIEELKENGWFDLIDGWFVMEYVSYPTTFIKPVWLIRLEIWSVSRLLGKPVMPIFSYYDFEWFANKTLKHQYIMLEKLKKYYHDYSVFAWSNALEYKLLEVEQ